MRPDPNSAFRTTHMLASLGLILAGGLSWWSVPLPILILTCALGLVVLLRVPRRLRLLELAAAFLVLGIYGDGLWTVGPAALCALACLLAPEERVAALNGMDRFLLIQEYPGMAVNIQHVLDSDRRLEPAALESALDSLMVDVPLLRSFVREGAFGIQRFSTSAPWVRARDLIHVSEEPVSEGEGFDEPFDLERMPPLRVFVRPRRDGGWRTVLSVHHSLCDGTGEVMLFHALMRRYTDALTGRKHEPVPHLTGPYPRYRDLLFHKGPGWLWRMIRTHVKPSAKVGVVNASVLEDEAAVPIATKRPLIVLERETMERLWEAAKGYRSTRNHLYLAAALRAAESWRRVRDKPALPFNVMMTIDLRPLLGLQPGLGNYSGILNLTFTPSEITGDGLLGLIQERLRAGRRLEEAIEAPINLGVTSALLPVGTFRKALVDFDADTNSFFFSFGFTAVNFPAEGHLPSDVDVQRVTLSSAIARHPGFGVGPIRDRDRVYLAAVHRLPSLSEAGAQDFLRRFQEELDELIEAAPERKKRGAAESSKP